MNITKLATIVKREVSDTPSREILDLQCDRRDFRVSWFLQ